MKRWLIGSLMVATVMMSGDLAAQYRRDGPEPRYEGGRSPGYEGGYDNTVHGFCYSQRTGKCSSVFDRPRSRGIERACREQGWFNFRSFDRRREAWEAHRQLCRG